MSVYHHPTAAFGPDAPFLTLRRVRTPRPARWAGRLLLLLFALAPVALLAVPWQQTVRGRGQIVAFAPTERRQVVTARVGGQVGKWHVVEGSKVKAGDRIVDIDDNDPELATRLAAQRRFLECRLKATDEELAEQRRVVAAQERAVEAAVRAARASREASARSVEVAKRMLALTEVSRGFQGRRSKMFDLLASDPKMGGLVSELVRDEAQVTADRAKVEVLRAGDEVERSQAALANSDALILQAEAAGLSNIAVANGNLRRAEQGRFGVERELQELDTRIERFRARFVVAPCDGVVLRVSANVGAGGQYVKEGDELAEIVPDATDRVVEVLIDGVDAPLVAAHTAQTGRGPHVRLQFEGWPAVQFAGWPSVAVGTFGGRVRQMDPTDDGYGRFRVLVEPEAMWDGDTWPEGAFLRQGNQAVGWVFLNRVTLGYELWRQFNGFPPVIAPKSPGPKKDKDAKPPKIKV